MLKAVGIGPGALLVADAVWFALLLRVAELTRPSLLTRIFQTGSFVLLWGGPIVAAGLCAYLAGDGAVERELLGDPVMGWRARIRNRAAQVLQEAGFVAP